MPMVTESFSGWREVAAREVERLGAALACQSGQDEEETVWQTCHSAAAREYWQIVCLSSLPPLLMADIEIPGGLFGLRLCRSLGTFVCIDGKYCEKDAIVE